LLAATALPEQIANHLQIVAPECGQAPRREGNCQQRQRTRFRYLQRGVDGFFDGLARRSFRFPTFISSCGLGGCRTRAAIVLNVSSSSFGDLTMETPEQARQTRAFALVGEFLFHWNYIESRMTEIIQWILRLPHPEAEIVLANVAFRDKTSMAQTLCHYAFEFNGRLSHASAALKLFSDIAEFSGKYRNVLVHNSFDAHEYGGIEILRVRAKGKFDMPTTIWDVRFFEERFREIDGFDNRLEQLRNDLEECPMPSAVVDRMMQRSMSETIEMTSALARARPQARPPEASTDSPRQPPKSEKGD
jgi:hypothetical protein